jgi:uncharacterized protein
MIEHMGFILLFSLVMGSTYWIRKIRGSLFREILRNLLIYLPFLTPVWIWGLPEFGLTPGLTVSHFMVAIGFSLMALAVQYKDLLPYFSQELYPLLPPMTFHTFIITQFTLIGSVFFEELFYRAYVPESSLFIECIWSGAFFSFAHYIQKWTRRTFDRKSYILVFLLGASWYYSYTLSGSLLPALAAHLLYNLPTVIITIQRFRYTIKSARGEECFQL